MTNDSELVMMMMRKPSDDAQNDNVSVIIQMYVKTIMATQLNYPVIDRMGGGFSKITKNRNVIY